MKKRLYFDMDGVLVDFQSGLDKVDKATLAESEKKLYFCGVKIYMPLL